MLINHLIIALRIIRRHKAHAAINIIGLALAMAVSIIMLLYAQDDLGFEKFHTNADRIYRVIRSMPDKGQTLRVALTPLPLAAALKHDLVDVEDAVSVSLRTAAWVRHADEWIRIEPVHYTDPAFFRIFSFETRSGSLTSALREPRSAVLTETLSRRIFGRENPVGKTIHVRSIGDLSVAAVIDNPRQTHLRLGLILPSGLYRFRPGASPKWINNFTTYILASKYQSKDSVKLSISKYSKIYIGPQTSEVFQLQALRRIWLHAGIAYDFLRAPYDIQLDYLMLTVALGILAMACINYINIETARASRRAAEVVLRKAFGARRRQLMAQFLGEACVLSLLAAFLAVILVDTILPAFNRFTLLKELKLFDPVNKTILLSLLGVAIGTGLTAGSYPALLLSAIQPARGLKKMTGGITGTRMRKALVVAQFSVSIMLIIATLVLAAQLEYMRTKDPGYDPKHIVYAELSDTILQNFEAFKADLLRQPGIISVTAARDTPTWRGPSVGLSDWEGKKNKAGFLIYHGSVDRDFIETLRIELVDGISFAQDDTGRGLIVNQLAVEKMGLSAPVGRRISGWQHEGRIIGVVKNYHFNNMREKLEPLVLKVSKKNFRYLFVRISPENVADTIAIIEQVWRKFEAELPVKPIFLENELADMYLIERKVAQLFTYGSLIAIWISCLGLYGLTTFIAAQRSKEIAIRKSYGASIGAILSMLVVEHLKLVLLANLITWPVAYVAMNHWLAGFEQRVQLGVTIFILAAVIAIGVVLITVSFQALKTASANPVEALRYE